MGGQESVCSVTAVLQQVARRKLNHRVCTLEKTPVFVGWNAVFWGNRQLSTTHIYSKNDLLADKQDRICDKVIHSDF